IERRGKTPIIETRLRQRAARAAPVRTKTVALGGSRRGRAMQEISKKPGPAKTPAPSSTPLWFVAIGLGIALYSRALGDEMIGNVVFLFGLAFSIVAMLYWFIRPRHGL